MKDIPRRRRIRRSPQEIQALVADYRCSGSSARQFALDHQLPVSSFMNWLRRHRPASRPEPRWVEVHPQPASPGSGGMATLHCADGISIELRPGFEPAGIAQLVRLLRQP